MEEKEKKQDTFIPTNLVTKATATLEEEVKRELKIFDPEEGLAKAVIEGARQNSRGASENTR